ncbi:LysR family transcriptional regulator, partial [Escherichia coli]|uniref:LysR family transcriptional regulator n=1 Tax=Escherichia coli TaxID=562 RepID=UPI00227E5171
QRCHTVQSALSHQIAKLEEELGCTLFERTSRRVRLTPAGQAFIPSAQRLLAAQQALVEETGEMATGTAGRPAKLFRFRRDVLLERAIAGSKL